MVRFGPSRLPFHRICEVRIVEDDGRTLSPELQSHTLEIALGCQGLYGLPRGDATSEADLGHVHVRCQKGAGAPVTAKNLEHTGRKAGFQDELPQSSGSQWRLLARLQNKDVACSQCRGSLEPHRRHRPVPGDDSARYVLADYLGPRDGSQENVPSDDTQRLVVDHLVEPIVGRKMLTAMLVGPARVVAKTGYGGADFPPPEW